MDPHAHTHTQTHTPSSPVAPLPSEYPATLLIHFTFHIVTSSSSAAASALRRDGGGGGVALK